MITQTEHQSNYNKDTLEKIYETRDKRQPFSEQYSRYEDALITQVCDDLSEKFGISRSEASEKLCNGGLRIWSAQVREYQDICEKVCEDTELIPDGDEDVHMQAAVILMDIHSGYVLAHTGGNGRKNGSLLFDRGLQSQRNAEALYVKNFLIRTQCEDTFENGICLADICTAFSAFENGGNAVRPLFYKKVTNSRGETALSTKTQRSSAEGQYRFPMPECTEIPTQNDIWIIGRIDDMVLGVWAAMTMPAIYLCRRAFIHIPREYGIK